MRTTQRTRKTRCLTYSAILAALGVVLLGVGAWIGTLDLTMAALVSMLTIYPVIEMKGGYPWMLFGTTALLSILLLPQKSPAFLYLFIGYYPIVKEKIESLRSILARILLKAICFHLSLAGVVLTSLLFFHEQVFSSLRWELILIYAFSFAAFWLFDYALTRFITLYLMKFRERFRIQ